MKTGYGPISSSIYVIALGCIILLMGGCAAISPRMSPMPAQEISIKPQSGESIVIFIRPSLYGGAVQATAFDITDGDNKFIGIVSAQTKVVYKTKPGRRMFMIIGESADFLEANLGPQKTYYVLVRPRMGWWKARFSLSPIRKADQAGKEFQDWLTKCQFMANTDASYQWARENEESITQKKEKYLPVWNSKSAEARMEATLLEEDGI